MRNDSFDSSELVEQLLFNSGLSVQQFSRNLDSTDIQYLALHNTIKHKSLIFAIIETLIIEEKFYETFTLTSFRDSDYAKQYTDLSQSKILQFGYEVIEEIFSRNQLVDNDNLYLGQTLKKCKLDIFLLMAICKGYLRNPKARRDKVRSIFLQSFRKNSNEFFGLERLSLFHQCLVQKSSPFTLYTYKKQSKQRSTTQLHQFLSFFTSNKDFFPCTLQHQNSLFKLMFTIKLQSNQDISLYQQLQNLYISDNPYHLTTTCKNIRFLMEFFRNPFNEKLAQFYPQKSFVRLLGRYTQEEIDKIVSFSEVGLTWGQQEMSTCVGNLFKLGLTAVTLSFSKALINLWLRGGLVDILLKLCQTYIPKTFIFLKHQKLFDISIHFLKQFSLGPRTPTIGIMNKTLQKMLPFYQKDCPIPKKQPSYQFLCLLQAKYQKTATLEDKLYVELKNTLKTIRQNQKQQLFKNQEIRQKLKGLQWQEVKVPLFGTRLQGVSLAEKQAGEYRGLYNVGNSCYMNSFLQCLYMNIEFRKKVLEVSTLGLEKNVLQKLHQLQAKGDKMMQDKKQTAKNIALQARESVRPVAELQRLFAQLSNSKRPCITPTQIKNVSSAQFKNTFQQDTIEFGRSFLDYVSRSSLQNMFEGQQTNEIICPNCKQSRYKKENFLDLMLSEVTDEQRHDDRASTSTKDSGNDSLTVEKMLDKFFQPQQIQNLTCDNCQTKSQKSIKKHFISKYPDYLILTLKRFCYDIKQNKNMKKHYAVDLKEGIIKVGNEMYQLYGVIVHRGQSANSGHYFAFCREWRFGEGVGVQGGVGIGIQGIARQEKGMGKGTERQSREKDQIEQIDNGEERMRDQSEEVIVEVQRESQKMQIEGQKQQQSQTLRQQQLKDQTQQESKQRQPQSNLNFAPENHPRWLCLNDSSISPFPSFQSIKQFLQLNQEDTPYILFYQKVSHTTQPAMYKYLKEPIKLRQPLEKFIEKDNAEYQKFVDNKKKANAGNKDKVDWKNFGKVKGFTAYDYFKFTKDEDEDQGNGGFGRGPGGFQPIL